LKQLNVYKDRPNQYPYFMAQAFANIDSFYTKKDFEIKKRRPQKQLKSIVEQFIGPF